MSNRSLLRVLARSFLAGQPTIEQIVARASRTLGRRWRWLRPLARRYVETFTGRVRPRHRDVLAFFRNDQGLSKALANPRQKIAVKQWLTASAKMQPVRMAANWNLPPIISVGALAEWLGVTPGELQWFADIKGLGYKCPNPRLRHYHYRVLKKMSGNIRLIEAPKPGLKELQQQILARILDQIPPHPAVHGFRKDCSIKTFVAPHVGRRVVLRMDLRDFFPTFSGARIQAFFRTIGYPEPVADLLGGICTNAAPRDAWNSAGPDMDGVSLREARRLYSQPHLPQGAPTSPALANLCAYHLDCRLAALAKSAGAVYTRYADDLAFSGDEEFEKCVERFSIHVAAVLLEEGFSAHYRKTRIMRQGVRQHLAGLVANRHANVRRTDFDRLKAILTNCARNGPESQNRERHPQFRAHLEGRIGFVEMINPVRGKRLRAIFERIKW